MCCACIVVLHHRCVQGLVEWRLARRIVQLQLIEGSLCYMGVACAVWADR